MRIKSFQPLWIILLLSSQIGPFLLRSSVPSALAQTGNGPDRLVFAGEREVLEDGQIRLIRQPRYGMGESEGAQEELFHGPVSFSVVYATITDQDNDLARAENAASNSGVLEGESVHLYTTRFFVDLQWEGMAQAGERMRQMQAEGYTSLISFPGMAFQLFGDTHGTLLGEMDSFVFDSPQGGWVKVDLPDRVNHIQVRPVRVAQKGNSEPVSYGVRWDMDLVDMTPHLGRFRSDVCLDVECLPGDFLANLDWQALATMSVPLLCPNQSANGVTIQRAWIEKAPLWWDFTRQSGFQLAPDVSGQQHLMIQVAQNPSDRSFSLAFRTTSAAYTQLPLAVNILYGDQGETIAIDRGASGLRSVEQQEVLDAYIPQGLPYQQALVIQNPFGPVWRLSCSRK